MKRWPAVIVGVIVIWNASYCTPGDPKFNQYYIAGEQLYQVHCANCHQKDGKGLRRVYPPVANSDFLKGNMSRVICGMKYGMTGEIIVNGEMYHQKMPGVISLTELELAEIATYLYNSWGGEYGLIDVSEVRPGLDSCSQRR